MTETVKGFLIDPFSKTVTSVEVEKQNSTTLKSLYNLIECQRVDCVAIDDKNDVWVDDEGLFVEGQMFFQLPTGNLLAGKGVVMGCNLSGTPVDTTADLEKLRKEIKFYNRGQAARVAEEMGL